MGFVCSSGKNSTSEERKLERKKNSKLKKKSKIQKHHNRIEYLHSRELAWRDLKPENLLVAGDGYLKLADLGAYFHEKEKERAKKKQSETIS